MAADYAHRHPCTGIQFAVSACIGVAVRRSRFSCCTARLFHRGQCVFAATSFRPRPDARHRSLSEQNARATDQPVLVISLPSLIVVGVAIVSLFRLTNGIPASHRTRLRTDVDPAGWFTLSNGIAPLRACLLDGR
jgi:uncharacterized membrane protein